MTRLSNTKKKRIMTWANKTSVAEAAAKFNVSAASIYNWRSQYKRQRFITNEMNPNGKVGATDVSALKRELARKNRIIQRLTQNVSKEELVELVVG